MGQRYQNILETIGRTPVVRLSKIAPEGINLYVKIESFNPMGSVKDRLALGVIEDAAKSGALKPGQRTTAPEILADFEGERLDYWVTGFGTGGTLKGVSRVLAKERPETKIIVCEPDNSQMLGSGIPQEKLDDGTPADSHPLFRPHLMQGWSPDFIPKLTEDAVSMDIIDQVVPVSGAEAMRLAKALATDEGIFVGISSGATLTGAMEVCKGAEKGTTVLCMLPDTGERYLSTPLFDDIPADMTAAEIEIANSTPGYRFGAPPPPPAKEEDQEDELLDAPEVAVQFVNDVTSNADDPVVMFSHEWCEFCWSVRKMFAKYEVPYRSIDLDSVEYQQDNKGGEIRAALRERTTSKTIPQIFIGGQYIGGATELFDACKDGSMQKLLEQNTVNYNKDVKDDPYAFLPGWLHKR